MNFKEKSKHLRDLHAPSHAGTDLELLKKLDPRNDQLPTYEHAPTRHAEYILFALLDLTSPEEIRNNRRRADIEKEASEKADREEDERLTAEKEAAEKAAQDEAERLAAERKAEEEKLRIAALHDLQAGSPTEIEKQKSELEEHLENVEIERDEAIEEKEELEEKLAETETALEETTAELEEEKKSEVKPAAKAPVKPANSKKKTNTRTSAGKVSKTKTSK